jgi:hypothetical protein
MQKTSTNYRRRPNPVRRDRLYRPFVELLEERLPPGDAILGALLGWSWTQAVAATPSFLSQEDPDLALEGRASLVRDASLLDTDAVAMTLSPFQGSGTDGVSASEGLRPGLSAVAPRGLTDGSHSAAGNPIPGLDEMNDWMDLNPAQPRQAGMRFLEAELLGVHTSADGGPGFTGMIPPQPFWMSALQATEQPYQPPEGLRANLLASGTQSPLTGPHGAVHALFHLDVQGEAPFPTNHFTVPARNNLTGLRVNLPYPDCQVFIADCQDLTLINQLDGFNMQPRLSIPFDGPIDVNSVTNHDVFLINLGDTVDQREHGSHVVGINQTVWDPPSNTLHVKSDELLDQHTRYALILTNGLRDTQGNPVEASEAFRRFRHDVGGVYKQELLDAIHAARRLGIREPDIVDASVFTTESATATLEKIRDQIHAATPDPANFNLGPKGGRTVFNLNDVTGIHWEQQTGDNPPSFTPAELNLSLLRVIPGAVGQIAFGKYVSPDYEVHPGEYIPTVGSRTGRPVVQGSNEIYFNLLLPSGPKPERGWPVAIFGHGSPLSKDSSSSTLNVAATMAAHGIATITINVVGHGFGPLSTLTVRQTDGTSVTFPSGGRGIDQDGDHIIQPGEGIYAAPPRTILDFRDGMAQTDADLMQLVRVIEVGMDVDSNGSPDLDGTRIYYFGMSVGGFYGTQFLAVEPDVRVGVLNVAGGARPEPARLSPITRPLLLGNALATRVPPLINAPGITEIDHVTVAAPHFNENMPLRNGIPLAVRLADGTSREIRSPVINTVSGAMEIQDAFDHFNWVALSGNPLGYASHLRKDPLPGVPAKSVIFQFAKGDMSVPNPTSTAMLRAGDLADRATFYRHDLAFAHNPALPKNPHFFMLSIDNPAWAWIAHAAQEQIATFFASDGQETIHPEPAKYFEVPIQGPLPEDLNYIP